MNPFYHIGMALREVRKKHGLSQRNLERIKFINRSMISRYENGLIRMSPELCELMDVRLGEKPGTILKLFVKRRYE